MYRSGLAIFSPMHLNSSFSLPQTFDGPSAIIACKNNINVDALKMKWKYLKLATRRRRQIKDLTHDKVEADITTSVKIKTFIFCLVKIVWRTQSCWKTTKLQMTSSWPALYYPICRIIII